MLEAEVLTMNKDWQLFKVYLMAGTFTFSGGMAMLPVIERELCQKRQLLPRDELYEYTTLSQTFPGVIALTNACFVGEKVNGKSGMLAAGLGAILPAFVLMLAATIGYQHVPQSGVFLSIMSAIRAASAAFLFSAAYGLARYNLKDPLNLAIAVGCLLATLFNLLSAPTLIILAGVIGLISARPRKEQS